MLCNSNCGALFFLSITHSLQGYFTGLCAIKLILKDMG